jgi:hypothetical protein
MKKGYKFSKPRPKEHNQKIGESVKRSYTDERRKLQSERQKLLWKKLMDVIKENKN